MIEIHWGKPLCFVSPDGELRKIRTIEHARYWLRKECPAADDTRQIALNAVESAMDCLTPVSRARAAVLLAAHRAGFVPTPDLRATIPV